MAGNALDDLPRKEAIKQIRQMHEKIGRLRAQNRILVAQNLLLKKHVRGLEARLVKEREQSLL